MKKICLSCKKEYERKNARAYCTECSKMISTALHRKSDIRYRENGGNEKIREKYNKHRLNAKESTKDIDITQYDSEKGHGVRVVLPFTRDFSKNNMATMNGRIVRMKRMRDAMQTLTEEVVLLGHKFYQGKIWLDITIYQPDHFGDALNYIDAFADAIQKAIGINDRWYAIKSLNWQINKSEPRLEIWILQNNKEHHAICQFCGVEKKFSDFNEATQRRLNKQVEIGSGSAGQRICLTCKHLK